MDPAELTLGDALKAAGYFTGYVGKWHLGISDPYHPNNRGYDEYSGFLGGSPSYFFNKERDDRPGQEREILHNREHVDFEGYLTDAFTEKSVRFIEKNSHQPFFLFVSYNAVHTPMHASEEDLQKFPYHPRAKLAAMNWAMDRGVGQLMDKLEELDLSRNTLIFFLSDNGGATNNSSSNLPFKGFKGNKYEGGHRTPMIISWPGHIPAGKTYEGLTSSLDIFATSLSAAGLTKSPGKKLDGVDLLPYLKDKKETEPHQVLYWRKEKMAAARQGDYKLIRLDNYGYRLYNLADDPGESRDLAGTEAQKLEALISSLENWEQELISPHWAESEPWQRVTFEIHKALMENREVTIKSPADLEKLQN
jgi:arylsulfatase A-like enzyme